MITCTRHNAPGDDGDRVLLVMLPGVGIAPAQFAERGMVAALHERSRAVDVVAARPALELYLDGTIAAALHQSIVEPALAQGYQRLWFLGISLGGLAALLYAAGHAAEVEGLVLLAPFLGTQGTIAELAGAGGLAAWSPSGSMTTPIERRMLIWLQDFLARRPARPALYLGYGRSDRFAQAHRMLAEGLPKDRVVAAEGGHDWDTWLMLWRQVLEAAPFRTTIGDAR